jgi:hypothetical protein
MRTKRGGGSNSTSPLSTVRDPSPVQRYHWSASWDHSRRMPLEADPDRDHPPVGLPQSPRLTPVPSDTRGMSITPALMELTHLSGISQVPSSFTATAVTMAAMVGASSFSHWGMEPPVGVLPVCVGSHLSITWFFGISYLC